MEKIAVIGTGITGLSTAHLLKDRYEVTLFEKADKPGGLIRCDRVQDCLFHRVGGHVFNSRNQAVLDWFWGFFDRDKEFRKANRNAKILMKGKLMGYPIENYLFQMDRATVDAIITDLLAIAQSGEQKAPEEYEHFEAFLLGNFGPTLYNIYFTPYNRKIWNTDLTRVPLDWLEGKLPMPNLKQILMSNIIKQEEGEMVHATFFYAKENGSQFIVDRLSEGLDIRLNSPVTSLELNGKGAKVNGEAFDHVVYTGDVRRLKDMVTGLSAADAALLPEVKDLPSNGTSNVFCECDPTDISWLYLPDPEIAAHRIIYTGTFAESNNRGSDRMTCVVEFSGKHEREFMVKQLAMLPGNLKPLDFNYEPNSYVLQQPDTRDKIGAIKDALAPHRVFLAGRFSEWEYHNMDKAIEAAMEISQNF